MKNFLLAISTGLLLYIGWPTSALTYVLFVAFIPLLWVEKRIRLDQAKHAGRKVLFYAWASFALFNVIGTWWVKNAHWSGTVATTIINGFLMAFVFYVYHKLAIHLSEKRARFALPFLWICIELLHQDWDLSFPWLNLGHGLATHIEWIQWYEYTGHLGGTLWIWILNLTLFGALERLLKEESMLRGGIFLLGRLIIWFVIPITISFWIFKEYENKGEFVNVVVVQPNIDSYTEKFEAPERDQLLKFQKLALPLLDDSVDYLVGPETMLVQSIDEDVISSYWSIRFLQQLQSRYPNLNIVTGAVTYKTFQEDEKTLISRKFRDADMWYEMYNSSLQVNRADSIPIYHKSKLVVAAEYMPFMRYLKPLLGDVVIDLGGSSGTLGVQDKREVFIGNNPNHKVGTAICWEAEFGGFMTGYAQQGANLIFAITNDGWWGDTDGHRQHMHYARIRAIENRRSIARSANTGISCFIDQKGQISKSIDWKKDGAISAKMKANNDLSFYSRWGDMIGRIAVFVSIVALLLAIVQAVLPKKD